jgi:hypothetical protein
VVKKLNSMLLAGKGAHDAGRWRLYYVASP